MTSSPLVKKLLIRAGQRLAILNAPEGYSELLGELPAGVKPLDSVQGSLDFVQVFVKTSSEVNTLIPGILKSLKRDGLLWVCYPKRGAGVETDLNRDILWKATEKFGLRPVSLVAVNKTWSAMRLRPADLVGK